jgi:mRNA interferase MazF
MTIEYGAIYTMAERGAYTGKPRPVVIVQNSKVELLSVLMVPLTTHDNQAPDLRIRIDPSVENGLQKTSFAMCDKIAAIAVANLGKQIGCATREQLRQIRSALDYLLSDSDTD